MGTLGPKYVLYGFMDALPSSESPTLPKPFRRSLRPSQDLGVRGEGSGVSSLAFMSFIWFPYIRPGTGRIFRVQVNFGKFMNVRSYW